MEVDICYAKTDQDCVDIHLFLCLIAQPHLMTEIDANDSIKGILDARDSGLIVVAKHEGHIIGTVGLVEMCWWYNTKKTFITNRWFFILDQFKHHGVGAQLEQEAMAFGKSFDLPVLIVSHTKQRNSSRPFFAREKKLE
jgi:Acetyltransferase (GNAT) family